MTNSLSLRLLRDGLAVSVVACFMFPLFWWGLNSIKPASAIFVANGVTWFDFAPTLDNYRLTLLGYGPDFFTSKRAILDTITVATCSTLLTLAAALPSAFALSQLEFRRRRSFYLWVMFHRILPPVAVLMPLVFIYQEVGQWDTRLGVILAHASMNLPFSVLLLKSFFDDIPREVGEAGIIDGATRAQCFVRLYLPLVRGGIAAAAVLCFIFSWTEFLMALFLTSSIRLLPVQLSLVASQTWSLTSALSTASIVPGFIFILLVQRHLVRGLTMGLTKG